MFSETSLNFGTHTDDNLIISPDDNELLFSTAVTHEWNRALSHNETMFPYVTCNSYLELSGYQRQIRVQTLLGLIADNKDDNDYASSSLIVYITPIIYNNNDQTCFIGEAVACSLATRYYNLRLNEQQYLIVNPMMQSVKKGKGTVNKIEKEMKQPVFQRRSDDSSSDDEVDVIFSVMFYPRSLMTSTTKVSISSASGGGDDITMLMADDMTRSILSSPSNTLSSVSAFYEYVNDESIAISSTTNEEVPLNSTEWMMMWADTLEGGVNTHNCSLLRQDNITFMDQWYTSDTVTIQLLMMREYFTSVVEACVCSLIQGVALNETVCHLEALSPIEPRGGGGARKRISLFSVPCTILTLMYLLVSWV